MCKRVRKYWLCFWFRRHCVWACRHGTEKLLLEGKQRITEYDRSGNWNYIDHTCTIKTIDDRCDLCPYEWNRSSLHPKRQPSLTWNRRSTQVYFLQFNQVLFPLLKQTILQWVTIKELQHLDSIWPAWNESLIWNTKLNLFKMNAWWTTSFNSDHISYKATSHLSVDNWNLHSGFMAMYCSNCISSFTWQIWT